MPRYEFVKGTSKKFWEIDCNGSTVVTTYGRIGSDGQKTVKKLGSPSAAKHLYDKLVSEKTRKGYALARENEEDEQKPATKPGKPRWDLSRAFQARTKLRDERATYAVELLEPGPLVVPTGKIFACDPYTMFGVAPFDRAVKKGKYPLILSVAKIAGKYKDTRVGCAMIRFAKGSVSKWINATKRGQSIAKLKPNHSFGYGVDSGTGCFGDASILPNLELVNDLTYENGGDEGWLSIFTMEKVLSEKWAQAILDTKTKANIMLFKSGFGDGFYPSYWGLSKSGQTLCLVTDFGVYPTS